MESQRWCNVNRNLVPIKAHYFFLFGGFGGTLPYMQVFAKDFGISATAVGIIYTIVPFCVCLSKPLFGFITDKFRNIRTILLMLLMATALAFYSILYIPPIKDNKVANIEVANICKDNYKELAITPPTYSSHCAKEIKDEQFRCNIYSTSCLQNQTLDGILKVTSIYTNDGKSLEFTFHASNQQLLQNNCDCLNHKFSDMVCEPNFYKCESFKSTDSISEYTMCNFWIFVLLVVIAGTGSATAFCLTDAACYEILIDNPRLYGRQRLWATISWGMATLITGYLNDFATGQSIETNYSPGFYFMLVFAGVDILILSKLPLEKANISTNICKDVGTLFSSWRTIIFSIGVYICGALTGLLWTYQFWFLTELGASQMLLGMVAGVQCLVAEVPFFFFSGWFIKKFGHFYCLIAALLAFSARIGLYSILENPWMVLPIDVLHGVTYALLLSAMTLYAVDFAPPGTEATMLGILGGIFEGLGVATGSFLGGIGFDSMGGRWTFFVASMVSLCCVPIFTLAYKILPRSRESLDLDWDTTIYSNDFPNYGGTSNSKSEE